MFPSDFIVMLHHLAYELKQAEYNKNLSIRTLNFEGQVAVGSYLRITNSSVKLLGS